MGATVSSLVTKYSTANAQLNNQLLSWIQSKGITGKRMAVASLCGAIPLMFAYLGMRITGKSRGKDFTKGAFDRSESRLDDEVASIASGRTSTESSLLKKHTSQLSVETSKFTYPSIRVFYRTLPKQKQLPSTLPLILFVHGLGGQVAQFQYLIDYFVHLSHVLGIDLPGCGQSEANPKDREAYSTSALVEIIEKVIPQYLEPGQKFVLIGHSMGCALAATLLQPNRKLSEQCAGFVAICPKAEISEHERKMFKKVLMMPETVFDIWRRYDRRGGVNSASVKRFVGKDASEKVRAMQVRFNEESKTPVWRRMVSQLVFPDADEWRQIKCPIYLLGAQDDTVCPVSELEKINGWLKEGETARPVEKAVIPNAGHSLIYEAPQVTSKLVGEFLKTHVSEELDLGWQLSYLKEDKWMLKNLTKWTNFQPVGDRVGNSRFRPMKTLRENDAVHNPAEFHEKYPEIGHIIDISHGQPPYESTSLGPIKYHKFPTVSKIPPTLAEVRQFIEVVDNILKDLPEDAPRPLIAVHCHYGFNRTGFFLVSYLIERCGYSVPDAIAVFKKAREPGIRHPHFKNELYQRYSLGGAGVQ